MKTFLLLALGLFCLAVNGQETEKESAADTTYQLPAPKGWGGEQFLIPISFAPSINYKGVEDIRFAPGWAKATSADYWTYAFLWVLQGSVPMDASVIENNLKAYYTGLIQVNGSRIPKEKITEVVTAFEEIKKEGNDLKTFVGTIKMTDYMQQQTITLNCKMHLSGCSQKDRTFIFYQLSPKPITHIVWKSLDQLWMDFKCDLP